MTSRALEAKHERMIKELSRLPANKRCANCETTGPSYVVTNFSTFVCVTCGGVHRQFGHRVKGITMATFKPEEVAELQAGGNEKALSMFLAKWTPKDLPKPVDRTEQKVKDWIEAVYVKKRYYSADAVLKAASPTANGAKVDAKRPATIEVPSKPVSRSSSGPPSAAAAAPAVFDPFGERTPSTTVSTPTEGAWADFGAAPAPTPATASVPPTPAAAPTPAAPPAAAQWQAFADVPAPPAAAAAPPPPAMPPTAAPPPAMPAAPAAAAAAPAAAAVPAAGWTAFGDAPAAAPVAPGAPVQAQWEAFGDDGSKAAGGAPAAGGAAAAPAKPGEATAAPKAAPPRELPLELFSEVQSLGLTSPGGTFMGGRPGAPPAAVSPMAYGGAAAPGGYGGYGGYSAARGSYGAAPAAPPPQQQYGYGSVQPAYGAPAGGYAQPGYGSYVATPTAAPTPTYGGYAAPGGYGQPGAAPAGGYGAHAAPPAAAPPAPAGAAAPAGGDVFASLAPKLGAALPSFGSGGGAAAHGGGGGGNPFA